MSQHTRLLVAHPDPTFAAMLVSMLRPTGYEIDVAEGDRSAARRLGYGPSLLVAAADPAEADALELLVYARRKHREVPVVVLWTAPDAARSAEALGLGAAAVLTHPCPPGALRAAVAGALSRSSADARAGGHGADPRPPASPRRDEPATSGGSDGSAPCGQACATLVPLKEALEWSERRIILQALRALDWNRREAARALRINRTTLYKKIKKYEILSTDPREGGG